MDKSPATEGRQLVWHEEFDGTSLDTQNKWNFAQTISAFIKKAMKPSKRSDFRKEVLK